MMGGEKMGQRWVVAESFEGRVKAGKEVGRTSRGQGSV